MTSAAPQSSQKFRGKQRIVVLKNAKIVGRWHDNRHMIVTEPAKSGAGNEVIMSIAGTSLAPCCRSGRPAINHRVVFGDASPFTFPRSVTKRMLDDRRYITSSHACLRITCYKTLPECDFRFARTSFGGQVSTQG